MSIASLAILFVALLFVVAFVLFSVFEAVTSNEPNVINVQPAKPRPSTVSPKKDDIASLDAFVEGQVKLKNKPKKSAGEDPKKRRKRWEDLLSGEEKNQHEHASKLLEEGQHVSAAKLFESLGMVRETVNAYQDAGLHAHAARALMRINRPHRAGIVFARGEMWADAARCFLIADMHDEAAKCYMQTGQFEDAAKAYNKVEDYANAASAFAKIGDFRKAAEAYKRAGDQASATRQIKLALSAEGSGDTSWLSESELALVQADLVATSGSADLSKALAGDPRLPGMIANFLNQKDFVRAEKLYQYADENARSSLVGKAVDGEVVRDDLIRFLRKANDHLSLGYALQRMEQFAQAAYEFEQVREWDLAISNYAKAGSKQDVDRVKKAKAGFDSGDVVDFQKNVAQQNAETSVSKLPVQRLVDMRLFESVHKDFIQKVEDAASHQVLEAGKSLNLTSADRKLVHFIISGRIDLASGAAGTPGLGRGDSIGQEGLMGLASARATYVAVTDVQLMHVKLADLKSFMDSDGVSAQRVLKNSLLSFQQQHEKIS